MRLPFVLLALLSTCVFVQKAPAVSDQDTAAAMAAAAERQRAAVLQMMAPALDRQRESIRVQARTATEVPAGASSSSPFFTVPWPKRVSMPEGMTADCDPLPAKQVDSLIEENAKSESISADLLREVMRKESGFKPCAVSSAGAQGLMQLMPATAQQFHVSDPFDPKQNLAGGAKFLKSLLERYGGDVTKALSAYNAGPARVDQADGVPGIPETQDYVNAILGALVLP